MTPEPAQRTALLRAILDVLAPTDRPEFKGSWMEELRLRAAGELAAEVRIDNAYADLRTRALARAAVFQKRADVRGLQGVVQWVLAQDARLEGGRPADVAALLATLDVKLDAARRFRLALDAWALRTEIPQGVLGTRALRARSVSRRARVAVGRPSARRAVGWRVASARERAAVAQRELGKVQPPPKSRRRIRRWSPRQAWRFVPQPRGWPPSAPASMDTAWEASSAAAGSLLMLDQAIAELRRITHEPQPAR